MGREVTDKEAFMGYKDKIEQEMIGLQNQLYALINIKEEVWAYHPSNPNFINPISLYESLKEEIAKIERKVDFLERELNSLN